MRDYAGLVNRLRRSCAILVDGGKCEDCAGSRCMEIDAADAIEELLAAVPTWISVEDELPEESGYTIVFCADGELRHVTFAKYQKTQKRWDLTGARSYWRITHWMPLPAPPEGGNHDN